MRTTTLLAACLLTASLHAQQVAWLTGWPVDYSLNPGLPDQVLAGAEDRLVGMRTVHLEMVYGSRVYGSVALDALDPASGGTLQTCLLGDSVASSAAVIDPAGIAYFSGSFTSAVLDVCDGSQVAHAGGSSTENHFLLAWDLGSGSIHWMRNISIAHPDAIGVPSLALDPDGNLWYAVEEWGIAKAMRVDAGGADVETRVIDNVRLIGTLSFDPWGGLYVSGSCENGAFTFGGQTFIDEGTSGYSMFVLRYRPDGSAGFVEFAEDVTFTNPTVAATGDGHAYLAGSVFLADVVWGDLQFHGPNWGSDVFLTKLDSAGHFIWGVESAPAGGPITGDLQCAKGPCVVVDEQERPYLAGTVRGVVDWGNGVMSDGQIISQRSFTVAAFDADGTPQWATTSQPSTWFVMTHALALTEEPGVVHFAVHAASEFTIDGHSVGVDMEQTSVVGRIEPISTGVAEQPITGGLYTWPNPATDVLFVEVEATTALPAELLSSAGQRVRFVTLLPGRNPVNVGGLAPGLYLLRAAGREGVRVVKE